MAIRIRSPVRSTTARDGQCAASGKEPLVRQLLRDEITLDQAAEHFREVIADDPKALEFLRKEHGATGDELYYRNVLTFAVQIVRAEPSSATADVRNWKRK